MAPSTTLQVSLQEHLATTNPDLGKLSPEQWARIFALIEKLLPIILPFITGV